MSCLVVGRTEDTTVPEQRKRLHCVAETTLSMTFLLASEVPAIAAFARSGLPEKRNSKTRQRGDSRCPSLTLRVTRKTREKPAHKLLKSECEAVVKGLWG